MSSPVEEIDALGLKGVTQVEATATGFLAGIMKAMTKPAVNDIEKIPSWRDLASRFETVLSRGAIEDWT